MANNSFAHTTVENPVENAKATYNSLYAKAKVTALTPAELQTARRAALIVNKHKEQQAKVQEDENRKFWLDRYMKQGYTQLEAEEKLRVEAIADMEYRGFGRSQRCKFDRIY